MSKLDNQEQKSVNKIVEAINQKRQFEFLQATDPKGEIRQFLEEQKYTAGYKRTGKAGWIKIAHIPHVVDQWFIKMYGENYYKEKDFFEKFPEWKVINADSRKV